MSKQDIKELKKLVSSFRHTDLRNLLGFAKRNNTGKKSLLLERVCEMIDIGCTTSILFKINEISGKKIDSAKDMTKKHAMDKSKVADTSATKSSGSRTVQTANAVSVLPVNGSLLECPHVKFSKLPFYEQLEVLVKPVLLKVNSHFGSPSSTQLTFKLSPQQIKYITDGQELINECMIEYKIQVLVRFCLSTPDTEQDDNLPHSLFVSVNDKAISLPTHQGPSSIDSKRPSRPLDITHACNLSPEVNNSICITNQAFMGNHSFTVVISKKLSNSDLLETLKRNSLWSPDYTRSLIKEKLSADADSEISTTSLKISLICPLSKVRMTVPIRSSCCNHLQCFDALTYVQMNEKKPTWICPICDKSSKFENLIVDGLFSEILSKVENSNEIQFFEDGNWKPLIHKKEEVHSSPGVVCLEVPDSPYSASSADTIVLGSNQNNKRKWKKPIAMVDLTADTDDDDDDDSFLLINESNDSMPSRFMI